MCNLQLLGRNPTLLQQKQRLQNALSNQLAPKDCPTKTHRLVEPIPDEIQQVLSDVFPVPAVEGRLVGVVHGFEDGVDGLVRNAQVQE